MARTNPLGKTQATLGEYATDDDPPAATDDNTDPSTTDDDPSSPTEDTPNDPLADVNLPDQTTWNARPTDCTCGDPDCNAEFVLATDRFSPDIQRHVYLKSEQMAVITSDIDAYRETHADEQLDVPQYYSRFEDQFIPYVGKVSARSNSFAWGITASQLEGAVRLATGGGRFRSDDLEVWGCGRFGALAIYDGRAVIVSATAIGRPEEYDAPTNDVRGMAVEEQDDTMLAALETFLDVVDERLSVTVTGYEKCYDGKHYFQTTDDELLRVAYRDVLRVEDAMTDREAVVGEYEYEDPWGETFSFPVSAEDVEYELGEQRRLGGEVVGYRVTWDDPRRSSRAAMSGRVKLKIGYVEVSVSEKSSGYRVRVRQHDETVNKRRPEGRKYQPMQDMGGAGR